MSKSQLQEHCQALRKNLPKYDSKRKGGPDHSPEWISRVKLFDGSIHLSSPTASKKEAEKEAALIAYNYLEKNFPIPPKTPRVSRNSRESKESSSYSSPESLSTTPSLSSDDLLSGPEVYNPDSFNQSSRTLREGKKRSPPLYRRKIQISGEVVTKVSFPNLIGKKIAIFVDVENSPRAVFEFNQQIGDYLDVFAILPEKHPLVDKILPLIEIDPRIRLCKIPSSERDAADIGLIMAITACIQDTLYDYYLILTGDHFGDVLANLIGKFNSFNPTLNAVHLPKCSAECFRTLSQLIVFLTNLVV